MNSVNAEHLKALIPSFEGAEAARISSIAFFALFVYEWFITLDDEVKYFWNGPWNMSRLLFFLNRYIPPMIMILALVCFFTPNPTAAFCLPAIRISFIANIAALGVIQAVLVLRVWYIFSNSDAIRWLVTFSFLFSLGVSLGFAIIAARDLRLLPTHPKFVRVAVGCQAERPKMFWRMFLPSLILHTLLYVLTAIRALRNRQILKSSPVLKRLLRDGGFFYFVVFVSVGFSAIGSFLTQYPLINIPVVFSDYLISVTSIAVSRVLFSIHSLAENLGSDTAYLLNNAELSRVGWRRGNRAGEIIVERWTVESPTNDYWDDQEKGIMMTRVGTFEKITW